MAVKPNTWKSPESAARSPLARSLRELAPAHNLYTTTTEHIRRRMGYSSCIVVIAEMRKLERLGVIRYIADRGKEASITFRVILDA